jgi:lysophospholipase L1-like esterase
MISTKILKSIFLILTLSAFSLFNISGQKTDKTCSLDLVFIGNSITHGGQLDKPELEAPPAIACDYLKIQKGVAQAYFVNRGVSGFTTVDFLPGPSGELADVITATRQFHNDSKHLLVFSISLGTNDSAEEGPNGSPVSPESYRKNIKSISDRLLNEFPKCKIVLQQPIWYSPTTYNRSRYLAGGLARLQSYFPELQNLVNEYSKTNPGHVYMGVTRGFEYFRNNYLTDFDPESGNAGTFYLHPNKKGSAVLGTIWGEGIYNCIFAD